ncbi:MAG TPA: glycosyltransferase [Solirubrobacteraceae bacterium]|nr:glycosyltransferase [Solirubrobacteraceae bacterium]
MSVVVTGEPASGPRTRATVRPLRIADVTMFYGERSGGIRTYLEAKASYAARTGHFEHHLVIPGRTTSCDGGGRHEHRSVRLAASNGYRLPLGGGGLQATLHELAPDVVLLHDPFWTPRGASRAAHECGAAVIAVHHSSASLHAAGLPGPDAVYAGALRRWYRRAYLNVDALMSVVDTRLDVRRPATLRLRFGLEPSFHPRPEIPRGDHVLYVGRLSREKGLRQLLEAAAASAEPWPLVLLGTGPMGDTLRERARQLGLGPRITFDPYVANRTQLAERFAAARCAVLPGAHETFGLAALEAAACATPVVTAEATPSAALLDGAVDTFRAGDSADLLRAIERARRRAPDPARAARLVADHSWEHTFAAELADLERLLGR